MEKATITTPLNVQCNVRGVNESQEARHKRGGQGEQRKRLKRRTEGRVRASSRNGKRESNIILLSTRGGKHIKRMAKVQERRKTASRAAGKGQNR